MSSTVVTGSEAPSGARSAGRAFSAQLVGRFARGAGGWMVPALAVLATTASAQLSYGTQEAKLSPAELTTTHYTGIRVAVSDSTLVASNYQGSCHVFERQGTTWTGQATLSGFTGFGSSTLAVAIDGETLVVGDYKPHQFTGSDQGVAHVFVRSGRTWVQQAVLAASDGAVGDIFGWSVGLSGDTLIVGARGVHAAYVFVRVGDTWSEQAKLTGGGSYFGEHVAVSGDTALVGGPLGSAYVFERSGTRWSQAEPLASFGQSLAISGDAAAICNGAISIFVRNGGSWALQAILAVPAGATSLFGQSSALSDEQGTLIVGDNQASAGSHSTAGVAHVFTRTGSAWTWAGLLSDSDAGDGDALGTSVAISADIVVAGAPTDDHSGETNAGSVSVFRLPWTKYLSGLEGSLGVPVLEGTGSLVAGTPGALRLSEAPNFAPTLLLASLADNPTPFKGGMLEALPPVFQLIVPTFLSGQWTLPWTAWPAGIPAGFELYFQVAVADAAAIQGVSISNLLRATQP